MAADGASAPGSSASRAYALLTLAFLFFALNIVVGRAAHTDIPPVGLSFWRWTIAALLFLPFSIGKTREQWHLVAANWKRLAGLSVVLILFGNTLVYVGLQSTTALNGGLIPVSRPVIILVLAWLLLRGTVTRNQWLGIVVALFGVLLVIARGDPQVFAGLSFNPGDAWIFASSIGIASYQVLVARIPKEIHPNVLLQSTITFGALLLLPVYVWETVAMRPVEPTLPAVAAILFVAIFPSIISVYLINHGIATVGPARVGIFNYLTPLFVAMIAIPVLGETMRWYHPVALALVAAGILISTRGGRRSGGRG